MSEIDAKTKIWLYRKMVEIRLFEEVSLPFFQKPGHGSHHPCIGHEAIEAAIGAVLSDQDYLFGSHRSHGTLLSKGLEPKLIMAELWGKTTGYCHGRGGSMHVTDAKNRVMVSGIVGTSVTLAVGAALAIKLRGENGVALASFGDGAVNCGAFHEGLNMASVWKLPAVFVCENNGLAVTTRMQNSTSLERLSERASAYLMPGYEVDGTDPIDSYNVVLEAYSRAITGGGPSLISATVPRWKGHAAWDDGSYLGEEKLEEMLAQDPLPKYQNQLKKEGLLSPPTIKAIDEEYQAVMDQAIQFAEESPAPALTKEEAGKFVFTHDFQR